MLYEYVVSLVDPDDGLSVDVIVWARSEELAMLTAMTRYPDMIATSATSTGTFIEL